MAVIAVPIMPVARAAGGFVKARVVVDFVDGASRQRYIAIVPEFDPRNRIMRTNSTHELHRRRLPHAGNVILV